MLKDPYIFDVANYGENVLEKDIEDIWTKLGCDYYEKSND